MISTWRGALVAAVLLGSLALGRELTFLDRRTIRDSLCRVHPRLRASWLKERGTRDEYWQECIRPADSGLRCVGRWSFGPAYDVDGRVTPTETLVALARGSGVSLIRFARTDSIELELLADVNAGGLMKRVAVRDSLLYVGSTAGLEIWTIADERNPRQLSWLHTALNDFSLQDSFAYVIGPDDSFKVYDIANPGSPLLRGACRDSGYTVAVMGDLALVGDRWGLYLLDVRDPASPHRVNSWGSAIDAVATRGSLACVTQFNPNQPGELKINTLDVSDPLNVRQLGYLDGAGGLDVHFQDSLVFCSGDADDHSLKIVSIADSTRPRLFGAIASLGWGMAVWASAATRAAFYASNFQGMEVYDVSNPASLTRDTMVCAAGPAEDVDVENNKAYVAQNETGLAILDVSDPSTPVLLGKADTVGIQPLTYTACAHDSFAFVGWTGVPYFRSFDVSDPTRPRLVGGVDVYNFPEDMALRNALVYVVEDGRLQIVDVTRPRQPVLVGSCVVYAYVSDLELRDTLAYVAGDPFSVVNVARAAAPFVVRQWNSASGVDIADTIAYLGTPFWLKSVSVARPTAPYVLDSLYVNDALQDVVVLDTLAIGGGNQLHVFSIADPRNLRLLATATAPAYVQRLVVRPPFIWAACDEAGICVLETVATGLAEIRRAPSLTSGVRVWPTPTSGLLRVRAERGRRQRPPRIYNATGVRTNVPVKRSSSGCWQVDLSSLPDGVYLVSLEPDAKEQIQKVIKTKRR